MDVRLTLAKIVFNDDTTISLKPKDIMVLTGSNNVGKSIALKNIFWTAINNINGSFKVIKDIQFSYEGTANQAFEAISARGKIMGDNIQINNYQAPITQAKTWWTTPMGLQYYGSLFVKGLFSEGRLNGADRKDAPDFTQILPNEPLHFLYQNGQLEQEISDLFHQAFNQDLMVNRHSGSKISLHVGTRPEMHVDDKYLTQYHEAVSKLPLLETQGDGMRSFVTILLQLFAMQGTLYLLDEPEAFLHPPQVKILARYIAKKTTSKQLIIATHSADFVKSMLETDNDRINIIRLERREATNKPYPLKNDDIRALWKDPMLKYSSILDGLFHDKVVICESEGDCRFYTAILEEVFRNRADYFRIPDTLFLPSHGKAKIPDIVHALKAISVTTVSICDFDIFNNETPLRQLIEAHGGEWVKIAPKWKIFYTAVNQLKPQLERNKVEEKLIDILKKENAESLSKKEIEELREVLKQSTAWSFAKTLGIEFIPGGDSRVACEDVIKYMNSVGIFPLLVGELESFDKTVPGAHKSKWLEEVLKKDLAVSFANAKSFLSPVITYTNAPTPLKLK